MIKRGITIIKNGVPYETAAHGWTLTGLQPMTAEPKEYYVDKPHGDGSWDLTGAITDGITRFFDVTLNVTLECSEGDRLNREEKINALINEYHGEKVRIKLPDDPDRYMEGRVKMVKNYNDLAHASITLTGTLRPWKYSDDNTVVDLTAETTEKSVALTNLGRLTVVPIIQVIGTDAQVRLTYGTKIWTMTAGTYQWPELVLTPGGHVINYVGKGTLRISYREAVLA